MPAPFKRQPEGLVSAFKMPNAEFASCLQPRFTYTYLKKQASTQTLDIPVFPSCSRTQAFIHVVLGTRPQRPIFPFGQFQVNG